MSCYEKREITFVFKNYSFQAWNVFLIFYSSQLVLTSVGACIHKATGLKQHYWDIDQKIKPLRMKLKSRQGLAHVKLQFAIYSFKIRMLERVQPIASVPNREQQESSFRGAPKGCDPKLQSYCSVFQNESKSRAFAAALHWCYCHQSLPCLPSATWCRAAQEKEWSASISSQILSGEQGPLCCQPIRHQEEICPTVVRSWPHSSLQRACSLRSFHGGVQAHWDNNSQLCTETGDHTG